MSRDSGPLGLPGYLSSNTSPRRRGHRGVPLFLCSPPPTLLLGEFGNPTFSGIGASLPEHQQQVLCTLSCELSTPFPLHPHFWGQLGTEGSTSCFLSPRTTESNPRNARRQRQGLGRSAWPVALEMVCGPTFPQLEISTLGWRLRLRGL